MQENLSCDFFYFFESFLELFWAAFSHPIKVDITPELHTTPSKDAKLEYHTEGIADSPVENSKGVTRTENASCFAFEEFTRKDKSTLCILIRESTSKYSVKEIFQNSGHIHMPNREDKYELISRGDFCLNSLPNRVRFFHICFLLVVQISHFELSRVEIEYLNRVTIFFFRLFVCFCYCMSKSFRARMGGDDE